MTPSEVIEQANQQFNSVGDSFFPDTEAYFIMWKGCMELAVKAYVIEDSFTTTTVAGTQEYAFPTNALAIKRVTYNGKPLECIDFRQDDMLTIDNASDTTQGPPEGYVEWEDTLILRPLPDGAYTLKVYAYCRPQVITSSSSSLEIPTEYHMALVDLLVAYKSKKNKDYDGFDKHMQMWDAAVQLAVSRMQKKRRANRFKTVTDVDALPQTFGRLIF